MFVSDFIAEENLKSLEPKEAAKWQKYLGLKSEFYLSAVSSDISVVT